MSKCFKIQLREIKDGLPFFVYSKDGSIYLDIEKGFSYSEGKSVASLSKLDELGEIAVINVGLPKTQKNNIIFKEYGCFNSASDQFKGLDVNVIEGASILPQDVLQVIGKGVDFIEVDLLSLESSWVDKAKNCKLCDIDLGTFTYTCENLVANWSQPIYGVNNSVGYYFPLVNYGNWETPAQWTNVPDTTDVVLSQGAVGLSDFRPMFHLLFLLEKGFEKLGFCFRSPVLETEWGRRIILYLLRDLEYPIPELILRESLTDPYWGYAESFLPETINNTSPGSGSIVQFLTLTFPVNNNDVFNYLVDVDNLPISTVYGGTIPAGSSIPVCHNISFTLIDVDREIQIDQNFNLEFFNLTTNTVVATIPIVFTTSKDPQTFEFDVNFTHTNGDFFQWRLIDAPPTTGTLIYNLSDIKWVASDCSDRVLDLSNLIDCEKTLFDLLEGTVHLLGDGLFKTDGFSKKVTLFHPEKIDVFGEAPEPFFVNNTFKNIKRDCSELSISIKPTPDKRFIDLCFADSSDQYIEQEGLTSVWRNQVDLKKALEEDSEEICNPCFEPTVNANSVDIKRVLPPLQSTVDTSPSIPFMWDNQDHTISKSIGYRILLAWGLDSQVTEDGVTVAVSFKECFTDLPGFNIQQFPQAGQLFTREVGSINTIPQLSIVFGGAEVNLLTMFWKFSIVDRYFAQKMIVSLKMNRCQFDSEDFREPFLVNVEGKDVLAKLDEIEEFDGCSDGFTDIFLIQKLTCSDVGL